MSAIERRVAPDRYMLDGVETIDKIRRELREMAGRDLGDCMFIGFCIGNVRKYGDRVATGGPNETRDREKRAFYEQLAQHVMGNGTDPRSDRPGFVDPFDADPSVGAMW